MLATFQEFWLQLYSRYDRYTLDCLLPIFVSTVVFVGFNIPFLILDLIGCPKFLMRFKVQQTMNVPAKPELVWNAVKNVSFNALIVTPIFINVAYFLRSYIGCYVGPQIPTLASFFKQMAIIVLVDEIGFYYGHRFFHSSWMYKRIHKKHHEWTAPISVVSLYCHPIEHVLVNLGPIGVGAMIAKADTLTATIWYGIALFSTICVHSGYDFPLLPSPRFHDYHHEKFNECYGVIGVLDFFHGTSVKFRKKHGLFAKTD